MKFTTREHTIVGIGLVTIAIILALSIRGCINANKEIEEKENLNEVLNHQLYYGVDKYGRDYTKQMAFMTDRLNEFTSMNAGSDSLVLELQKTVKDLKGKLKGGDNVTVFVDTSKVVNTTNNIIQGNTRTSKFQDKWIDYTIISKVDSTTLDFTMTNEYSVAVIHDTTTIKGKKKRVPVAVVTSYNPYTKVSDVRTYKVSLPKPPRFGFGVQAGVGATYNGQIFPGIYLGVGLQYTIFHIGGKR